MCMAHFVCFSRLTFYQITVRIEILQCSPYWERHIPQRLCQRLFYLERRFGAFAMSVSHCVCFCAGLYQITAWIEILHCPPYWDVYHTVDQKMAQQRQFFTFNVDLVELDYDGTETQLAVLFHEMDFLSFLWNFELFEEIQNQQLCK